MTQISIIDDDFASELIVENLQFRGYEARRFDSFESATGSLAQIATSDLVVLDLIMPRQSSPGVSGARNSGMELYAAIRKASPEIKIIVYTASRDPDIVDILGTDKNAKFIGKWSTPSLEEFSREIEVLLGKRPTKSPLQTFIVHGHDEKTKLEVKNYLQNVLKLSEPIILHEQPNLGRTIIEKFESYSSKSQLAIVILTPDDRVVGGENSNDIRRRARQNVIFELGYFLGSFGRSSGRVFLLYKGPLELPSDLAGVIYIDITNGVEAAGEQLRRELQHVVGA